MHIFITYKFIIVLFKVRVTSIITRSEGTQRACTAAPPLLIDIKTNAIACFYNTLLDHLALLSSTMAKLIVTQKHINLY